MSSEHWIVREEVARNGRPKDLDVLENDEEGIIRDVVLDVRRSSRKRR